MLLYQLPRSINLKQKSNQTRIISHETTKMFYSLFSYNKLALLIRLVKGTSLHKPGFAISSLIISIVMKAASATAAAATAHVKYNVKYSPFQIITLETKYSNHAAQ